MEIKLNNAERLCRIFDKCDNLKKVTLSGNTTNIWDNALKSLKNLKIFSGKNVKIIGINAFRNCISLESVEFGDNLGVIGHFAFANCQALKSFNGAESLKNIYVSAFRDCKNLEGSFIFKNSVDINQAAFYGCVKLKDIHFKEPVKLGMQTFVKCENLPEDILLESNYSNANLSAFKNSNLDSLSKIWAPLRTIDESKYEQNWVISKEPLFPSSQKKGLPSPSDISQGAIGDCWLLAVLSSIAAANPEIIRDCMVDDPENNCVIVKLYEVKDLAMTKSNGEAQINIEPVSRVNIKVERSISKFKGLRGPFFKCLGFSDSFFDMHALWVRIMEKAIATYLEKCLGNGKKHQSFSNILEGSSTQSDIMSNMFQFQNYEDARTGCIMSAITGTITKLPIFNFVKTPEEKSSIFKKTTGKEFF